MRLFLLIALSFIQLFSDDTTICKKCHPLIYSEFQNSFHKHSTLKEDKLHSAVWEKHPAKAKGDYKCAKCHAPNMTKEGESKGITCISCHTIKSIESHSKSNKNIYETKPKRFYSAQKGLEDKVVIYQEKSSWLGLVKEIEGSPYHDIDYRNEIFYTGEVCMGCHSHKQNKLGFDVCRTSAKGAKSKKENCISCHMPKVEGSATTIRKSQTHAFHGFAGIRNAPELLAKYIKVSYEKRESGFAVVVENSAPHSLLTHPLRVVELKTTLKRDNNSTALKTKRFLKVIGKEGKPSMPWLATEIVKDNMIKAKEKREILFDVKLQSGDEIETLLGYYIVNPKAVEKLDLEENTTLSQFKVLKRDYFKVE